MKKLYYTSACMTAKKKKYTQKVAKRKVKDFFVTKKSDQFLSHTDRLIYIYIVDINTNTTTQVVNVSYEIKIEGAWQTIIRYDSAHGYLHKHSRVSLDDNKETTTRDSVKRTGEPKQWLTWAIQDIQKNFVEYRRLIFKRSNVVE